MNRFKSNLIAFAAPSGAGKSTIARKLIFKYPELVLSISATTREKRAREKEAEHYFFLTRDQFEEHINFGNFLEYEEVHGQYYGTLKSFVEEQIGQGNTVVFDIDVNGALNIKEKYPQAILIFIKAPSEAVLRERLMHRKSETEESINHRLSRLPFEYEQAKKFDYIVVNDNLRQTIRQVEQLILKSNAEKVKA